MSKDVAQLLPAINSKSMMIIAELNKGIKTMKASIGKQFREASSSDLPHQKCKNVFHVFVD